jgi:electron transfer flavoprotein alpha subunit
MTKVWVYAEELQGQVTSTTLELLTKAREIGDTVEAFAVTSDAAAIAGAVGEYGATKLFAVDGGEQLPGAVGAAALADAIGAESPDVILFATSYDGRDVIGRLSARIDAPVITNATGVSVDGGNVTVESAIFGATKIVKTSFDTAGVKLVAVRPKSFPAEPSGGGAAEVAAVATPELGAVGSTKVLETHVEKSEGPKLEEADIVVSGGRGLGGPENFPLVEQLAEQLTAAVGASRAIVDAGWVPYSKQVGQTGKTVKPNVYIAVGISGAMQHMVGMKGSKNIIAINKDPEAPIHAVADLAIVGDALKVVPQLVEALKARG